MATKKKRKRKTASAKLGIPSRARSWKPKRRKYTRRKAREPKSVSTFSFSGGGVAVTCHAYDNGMASLGVNLPIAALKDFMKVLRAKKVVPGLE
jgi:hypothetical protein